MKSYIAIPMTSHNHSAVRTQIQICLHKSKHAYTQHIILHYIHYMHTNIYCYYITYIHTCIIYTLHAMYTYIITRLKRNGTRAENRFRLSPKRTSPFKSAGASVQSTAGCRGVRISGSNAGYTTFRESVRVLATHSIRQFSLNFPSRVSPCAIKFQTHYTYIRGSLRN